jgi:Cu(I)/Ag(I) efflux system periplasmic protein CusF
MKFLTALALASLVATGAHAQMSDSMKMPMPAKGQVSTPATSSKMTEGAVQKIDKSKGNVTLTHGPIENLGMPGMTMMFKVTDPKMLDSVKEGDKVHFRAERVGGTVEVTHIESTK